MTREEKQLLLKDLCARLPYGVTAYASEINKNGIITDVNITYNMVNLTVDNADGKYELVPLFDIKPYLRPMSSMTEEEYKEYDRAADLDVADSSETLRENLKAKSRVRISKWYHGTDWLNAHHFDYRGLIEMGLALEAKEGMYEKE